MGIKGGGLVRGFTIYDLLLLHHLSELGLYHRWRLHLLLELLLRWRCSLIRRFDQSKCFIDLILHREKLFPHLNGECHSFLGRQHITRLFLIAFPDVKKHIAFEALQLQSLLRPEFVHLYCFALKPTV